MPQLDRRHQDVVRDRFGRQHHVARTFAVWQLPGGGEVPNGRGHGFYSRLDLRFFPSPNQSVRYSQLVNRHKDIGFAFMSPPFDVREFAGPFTAAGTIAVTPIPLDHGIAPSLGFRFGGILYVNDVVRVPEEAFPLMHDADVLIVDAMRYRPHPTHAMESSRWMK